MNWPDVAVFIVTYDRPAEIRRVIATLDERVVYPRDKLHWHISDDGSPEEYIPAIQNDFPGLCFTMTVTDRKGWGANVNKGMGYVFSHLKYDYLFLCEDDYVAIREIDLMAGVALMEGEPAVGLVRYDGISGHSLNLYLREAELVTGGRMDYLVIDRASPHLNVYSHRPHLKHQRFHDKFGYYREGIGLGHTEVDFANVVKNAKGPDRPLVTILPGGIPRAFDHIGHSRQGTELDRPT